MNRIERVRQAVEENVKGIETLLAMRLLFPPENPVVTIEQEIFDLYVYPERLESSYRDEWQAIAVKAIYQHAFPDQAESDQNNLQRYLAHLHNLAIPRCQQEHPRLFRALEEIRAIAQAGNTLTFPDPRRKAIARLIWPKDL